MANQRVDVLLIGGGIMSTTLATLLNQLDNGRTIAVVEKHSALGTESSDSLHNAGTGHAAYCELNYTPDSPSGEINIDRAVDINQRFETSLTFWASAVERGLLPQAENFIRRVPHLSWVVGKNGVDFLSRRHRALQKHHLFAEMAWSSEPTELARWMPIMDPFAAEHTAATRVNHGTDVNFGALTRGLGDTLHAQSSVTMRFNTQVTQLRRHDKGWRVTLRGPEGDSTLDAGFVFVGAGGAALPLLQQAKVEEVNGYAAFPVSGLWLMNPDPDLALSHQAKVYGQAPVGAPPMSVPHLDTRYIDGQPCLLFGPFAGFTTKLLRQGRAFEWLSSVKPGNLRAATTAGWDNRHLVRYLVSEGLATKSDRMHSLQTFLPHADDADWTLYTAGQRVQIIKPTAAGRGKLEFGTEVVTTRDRTLSALLGASPGASTSVDAMLQVVKTCFPDLMQGMARQRLLGWLPNLELDLAQDAQAASALRQRNQRRLGLFPPKRSGATEDPRLQGAA